ncbi:MAG: glycoside hydrolase [Acidobacteriota bacterium]|nr:glycoside hydrolase [Acidobacteriota bacterium]
MRWRNIGPYRGGRTKSGVGIPGQPNVFYIGVCNGGVWRTSDYGRTWDPIFDHEPTGSIGAIAIAPSDPRIIYVGSGEGLQRPDLSTGDGIYKSIDAGKTWTHLGLRDGQQIPRIVVDPRDPDRLFVAVLGHPYGPNSERGIYRSLNGGKTFERVLFKDENTGGSFVDLDPANPQIVYASMWEARQGPWENAAWSGTGGGIFKSTDGGVTWRALTKGLPAGGDGVVQANLAIAPSRPGRIYATVAGLRSIGIFRSDDAGESWTRATDDPRPAGRIGGGDLSVPAVDPKNPDTVYITSTVTWKSVDAGKTWTGIRGAPGGDDYQGIWINPNAPETILLVSDQGAIVTVNGGQTWSSWYNQPTAQMYHVNADNAFPYRVCSGQQESGSACVSSRGNDGAITFRDWHPVGAEEYGYAVPDPLDPDIVYGGKITRYDRRTGQVENVSPKPFRSSDFRVLRTAPILFSPADPHTLFFASNTLWKTRDGGRNWQQISPDLTRKDWEIPPNVGKYRDNPNTKPTQRGVIYAVGASPLDARRIWAGTDDGLIHSTIDGGLHWQNVTPPQLVPFAKVSIIDAGHFDRNTAYAAINTLRLDDMRPHILRTHDGGKTWDEIVNGIPDGAPVNVVREDPRRKGLLFAGTEREVYASFDDGGHWQSLRLNMPATSIRDVIVKDDDLVAATHGRGFWILDDITPLRQMEAPVASSSAFLFKPQTAVRVRWSMNTDTPLPPDEPAGKNPPDGAIIDYYACAQPVDAASGPLTLEILDSAGRQVRRYASDDAVEPLDPMLAIPTYWVRPPQILSNKSGMHRFLWDMHYAPLTKVRSNYPMQAVFQDTPPAQTSVWAMPGTYTVKLTVNGRSYSQPLIVKMDPRVHTPAAGLLQQFTLSKQLYDDSVASAKALEQVRALRSQLTRLRERGAARTAGTALAALEAKAVAIEGAEPGRGTRGAAPGPDTLTSVNAALALLMQSLQEADVAPNAASVAAVAERRAALSKLMQRWSALKASDVVSLNEKLTQENLPVVKW